MVYRKRVYKKRTAKKAVSVVKKIVKRELHKQIEDKNADLYFVRTEEELNPSGTVNTIFVNPIVQGTDDGQRVGSRILPKSISLRMNISKDPDQQSGLYNNFRVILFRWHPDSTNYTPTFGDILNTAESTAVYNPDTRDQFTVIMDKWYSGEDLSNGNQSHNMVLNKKLNLKQYMNFQTNNNGACTNQLYCLIQSDYTGTNADTAEVVNIRGVMFYEDA